MMNLGSPEAGNPSIESDDDQDLDPEGLALKTALAASHATVTRGLPERVFGEPSAGHILTPADPESGLVDAPATAPPRLKSRAPGASNVFRASAALLGAGADTSGTAEQPRGQSRDGQHIIAMHRCLGVEVVDPNQKAAPREWWTDVRPGEQPPAPTRPFKFEFVRDARALLAALGFPFAKIEEHPQQHE
jgi:hypothetical protein